MPVCARARAGGLAVLRSTSGPRAQLESGQRAQAASSFAGASLAEDEHVLVETRDERESLAQPPDGGRLADDGDGCAAYGQLGDGVLGVSRTGSLTVVGDGEPLARGIELGRTRTSRCPRGRVRNEPK